jgi:Fe-S oxidoreductase
MKQVAFLFASTFAFGLFAWSMQKFIRIAALGKAANLQESWGQRVSSLFEFFFGQRKVAEESRSYHHLAIYWGFLVLQLATGMMMFEGVFGAWLTTQDVLGPLNPIILAATDWGNVVVFLAISYAFVRRLLIRPDFVPVSLDAMLILGAIMTLDLTHWGHHVFHMAYTGMYDGGSSFSLLLGQLFGLYDVVEGSNELVVHIDPARAHFAGEAHWWGHIAIILSFMNYLPYSKHIHVLGSGPNILLRNQGQRGAMPKLQLFDGDADDPDAEPLFDNWGVGRIEDFSWKSLLDNYSCTECARCTTYCPAYATDKPLSPMHLIHDLKDEMKDRGALLLELKAAGGSPPSVMPPEEEPELPPTANKNKIDQILELLEDKEPLVGGRIKDETLWACTTCGACQEVCPVFIDHPLKILQMRSHIVLNDETGRTPGEATRVIGNITDGQGNPWNSPADDRMSWAEGLDVPLIADNPDAEYLLFVGCAGAYDDDAKKTTKSLVKVLKAAGVSYAVLGKQEKCSGDTVRRLGDEMNFQMMAQEQVDTFNEHKVTKVIATCPHCFHVIKNEYPQFGGEYEVIHHSGLIAKLMSEGKLKVDNPLQQRMTYHDSCYLGRWNGVYDEPRDAIKRSLRSQHAFVELERTKEHGFCCGAGGGRMWVEEEPEKRVNVNRSKEIVDAKVDAVAVGCPFCKTMLSDGMKHFNKDEDIEILDIAQVVARAIGDEAPSPAAASAQSPASEETPTPQA